MGYFKGMQDFRTDRAAPDPSNKKAPTDYREGLLPDNDILLLVALCTIGCVFRAESLGAVVAGTAVLAGVHVFHGDDVAALLHLEEAGLMAIGALETLVGVDLAVKHDLAGALAFELDRLAGRNCECGHRQGERYDNNECQYEKFFHGGFTSFRIGMNKSAHEIVYRMKNLTIPFVT
jgi:hypothetical protein